MSKLYQIEDRPQNFVYDLERRISSDQISDWRPHLHSRFKKFPRVFAESWRSDDRLCERLRAVLPGDLSPTLVRDAERAVKEAGQVLRQNLFTLFSAEIRVAIERDHKARKERTDHGR